MEAFQAAILTLVAIGGAGVALTRDPRRQVLVASFYGLLLGILFFAFSSPDVALSEIVVGAAGLPALLLLALSRIRRRPGEGSQAQEKSE